MILNNTTSANADWQVSNSTDTIRGVKSPESWGTIAPSAPFDYTITFGSFTVKGVNNPDACITLTNTGILVTYPGA